MLTGPKVNGPYKTQQEMQLKTDAKDFLLRKTNDKSGHPMPHESLIFQDKPSIIKETLNTIGYLHFCAGFVSLVEGHFNPRLLNPKLQSQTFQPRTFQT